MRQLHLQSNRNGGASKAPMHPHQKCYSRQCTLGGPPSRLQGASDEDLEPYGTCDSTL